MMSADPLIDLTADYHLDLLATGVVLLDDQLHIRALNLCGKFAGGFCESRFGKRTGRAAR